MSASSFQQLTANNPDEGPNEPTRRTRASGDILDFLILEFKQNPNPPSEVRKHISEKTGMSERSVRIWFQNRRAKVRKLEKMNHHDRSNSFSSSGNNSVLNTPNNYSSNFDSSNDDYFFRNDLTNFTSSIPLNINEKYCFIDCGSLSVGSWQRVRTGYNSNILLNNLVNLSPMTINTVMNSIDLLIILSKKDFELNYFFSAIANNDRILFRIFFPITNILSCSLLDNNLNNNFNNELRLSLSNSPKFAVYFLNGVNSNQNQWSICDDFSEDQQVNAAHSGEGGTSIPHVLVGLKNSLHFLNSFILEHNRLNHNQQIHQQVTAGAASSNQQLQNQRSQQQLQQLQRQQQHQQSLGHQHQHSLSHDFNFTDNPTANLNSSSINDWNSQLENNGNNNNTTQHINHSHNNIANSNQDTASFLLSPIPQFTDLQPPISVDANAQFSHSFFTNDDFFNPSNPAGTHPNHATSVNDLDLLQSPNSRPNLAHHQSIKSEFDLDSGGDHLLDLDYGGNNFSSI